MNFFVDFYIPAKFVKYKITPNDTLNLIPHWQPGIEIFKFHPTEFQIGLTKFGFNDILADSSDYAQYINQEKIRQFWKFLSQHTQISEQDLAIWILNNDGNFINRAIAAALLINFSKSDLVWWTLMDCLRDSDARVSGSARCVLEYFADNCPRDVNWEPAINSLYYLINGTNLFSFKTVLKVLATTNLSKEILVKLLSESKGYLILSHLEAKHQEEREFAHNFLTKVTGQDFGYDETKWENYILSLIDQK